MSAPIAAGQPFAARQGAGSGIAGTMAAVAALAGACALLWQAAALDIDTSAADLRSALGPSQPSSAAPPAPATLPLLARDKLDATLQRPLFERSRRPPVADAAAAAVEAAPAAETTAAEPEPPPSSEGIRVVGTMRGRDGTPSALIRVPGAPRAGWVRAGDRVGAFTVEAVGERSVQLVAGSSRVEIGLYATAAAGREEAAAPGPGSAPGAAN